MFGKVYMRRVPLPILLSAFSLVALADPPAHADESIRMPTWSEPPSQSGQSGQAGTAQTGQTSASPNPAKDQGKNETKEAKEELSKLTDATSGIFGFAHSRAALVGYSASGNSVDRGGDYSAFGGSVEYQTGGFAGKETSKVYFGYELRGALGYQKGAEYKIKLAGESEPEGSITALGEIGPTLVPLQWGGVVLAPAIGLDFNGARYYESYVYLALAGRVQVFPAETVMISAQYGYVPWTAKESYTVREHHLEAAVHVADYGFGFRYQRAQISNAAGTKDAVSPTIGGFAALLF
jgi:hypothetical protein